MATNTTATATNHTGNGSTNSFAISFSFLANNEVDVTVAGVLKTLDTHYTISGSTVTFTSGNTPANGAAIKFQRDTNISTKKVDFTDGSVLTETDLDTNSDQVLFAQQEITDKLNGIEDGATGDQTAAEIKTLIASSPLDASHLAANSVNNSELVDGAVSTAKIADGAVTTAKIVDANITNAKIANNAVTAAKIADSTITQTQMATDSVSTDEISANAITTTELANLAVQTENIAVDGVRTTNIQNNAVTTGKIADDAVTNAKIADAELKTLAGMQSGTASKLADSTALTSDIADLNQLDGMAKQTTITDDDTKFPTSGAVVDYVSGQLDDIGGFESIANELSFPNTQAPNGVSISIADAAGLVVNGSGVSTTGRTLNGTTVTINNIPSNFHSSTIATGIRFIVTSTGSGQIYNYHKATLGESDLVSLSGDINDFNERYRVGSTNPTSNNDAGDLFFNTSTQKLLVYNGTSGAWEEAQSIGNFFISTLSPAFDGTTTDFTITNAPANAQQILLSIEGVMQKPNSGTSTPSEGFALSGSTVKLAVAPATGASYHAVVMGSTVNIGTPSDNTVTTAILQNNSVSSGKIQDDAVTNGKLADDAVTTAKIADDAVTTAKIADAAITTPLISANVVTGTHIANNTIVTGNIADDAVNADKLASNAVTNAKIQTNAVDDRALASNSVVTAVINNGAVTADKIGDNQVTLAKLPHGTSSNDGKFLRANNGADPSYETVNARAGRNVIINGDCQVAQYRGNAGETTGVGVLTTDRWKLDYAGHDEDLTQEHRNNSSGAPFELGLTHSFQVKNGNQTSTGASDYARIVYTIESQHMRNSGWDYKDSNSYITLSFWVKSSVSKNFYGSVFCQDSPYRQRSFETGTLTANTWTKVEISINGDSSINFSHDEGAGFIIYWYLYSPTSYTSGNGALNTWMGYNVTKTTPADTDSWWTADNATFDITGVQLEAGATATPFEMKSFDQVLHECKRYFCRSTDFSAGSNYTLQTSTWHSADGVHSFNKHNQYYDFKEKFEVEMRTNPTLTIYGSSNQGDIHIEQVGIGSSEVDWNNNTLEIKKKGFLLRHIEDSYGTSGSGNGFGILAYTASAEF